MTTTGTVVTVPEQEPAPPKREQNDEARRNIERRKAAAAVATLGWGKEIGRDLAYAVVVYCERRDIDPVTELDVLGNRPIPNARYWQRKVGELIHAGLVEWYEETYINDDPRLLKIGTPEATAEQERRALLRVQYNAPEEAAAIAVVSVKLKTMERPVTGCQWAGGGTGRKIGYQGAIKQGAEADPIGELFPAESALTRAWGKVGRIIAAKVQGVVSDMPDPSRIYAEAHTLGEEIAGAAAKRDVEQAKTAAIGRVPVKALSPGEYGGEATGEVVE